ncbi:hypothetical protein ACFQOY_03405 [Enterococcus alcedinis]|uniref:hypothetical protein n=1 Tax=Enterococcus alcedinis TaxID=1274384 RepID=UPI0036101422
MLKLYFSSSKLMNSNEITVKKLFERLENTNDNNDKNEYMHIYITRLCEGLVSDMYIEKKELISIYEQKIKRLYNQIYDLEEFIYEDIYSEDAEEEINQIVDRRIPKEKEEQASEIFKKISSSKFKKDALIIDLATEEVLVDKFATVISVYLKIEWEKAKEGK